jgi:hypothetical protein
MLRPEKKLNFIFKMSFFSATGSFFPTEKYVNKNKMGFDKMTVLGNFNLVLHILKCGFLRKVLNLFYIARGLVGSNNLRKDFQKFQRGRL